MLVHPEDGRKTKRVAGPKRKWVVERGRGGEKRKALVFILRASGRRRISYTYCVYALERTTHSGTHTAAYWPNESLGNTKGPPETRVYITWYMRVCLCCVCLTTRRKEQTSSRRAECSFASFPELNEPRSECPLSRGAPTDSPSPGPQLPHSIPPNSARRAAPRLDKSLTFYNFILTSCREAREFITPVTPTVITILFCTCIFLNIAGINYINTFDVYTCMKYVFSD